MKPSLEPLELMLEPTPDPLLPQVRQALAEQLGPEAEALRWAITAAHPPSSATQSPRLCIEAVVWRRPL